MDATSVDGYRVERVLSTRLGVHTVVEAVAPDGRRVAITLLDRAVADDPRLRRHVLELAQTRASIRHPNVIPLIGAQEVEDRVSLVSPLTGPRTLADRLRTGPLEPAETVWILSQVASALETAAAHGLVHRDLAPESIVFGNEEIDRVYLGDFGITLPPLPGCELADAANGIDYCSPEEVRGEPLEAESNVYSLACLLVECLTGAPPYPYDRPLLTMHAHVVEPPPSVSARRGDLPAELDDVIARAMAKDPRERFRSPGRLMRAAGEALGVEATVPVLLAPRPPDDARVRSRSRAKPPPRRARRGFGVVLPVVALCGFAIGLVDWSAPPAPPPAKPAAEPARSAEHVRAVGDAVDDLTTRRVDLRGRLRDARRPAGQAAAASALAAAYGSARDALPPASAGDRPLGPALGQTQRAYRRLASAARARDRRAWRGARREAQRREGQLERALR